MKGSETLSLHVFSLQSSESGTLLSNCCAQIAEPSTRAVMCTYFGDRLERNIPKALRHVLCHKAFQYIYNVAITTQSSLLVHG